MDEISIHHNDEAGVQWYSVSLSEDFDNWLDSFETLEEAKEFAKPYDRKIRVCCSIRNCKVNHDE